MDIMRHGARSLAIALSVLLFVAGTVSGQSYEVTQPSRGGIIAPQDPVWVSSRRFFITEPVFNLGGPLPVTYSLYYPAPYGTSIVQDYTPVLSYTGGNSAFVMLFGWDKSTFSLSKSGGAWSDNPGTSRAYSLKETNWYFYLVDPVDELVYVFAKPSGGTVNQMCDISYVMDRKGNVLTYTTVATDRYTVQDGIGRILDVQYSSAVGISVTDQGGRSRFRGPGHDTDGYYFSIIDALGNTAKYYWGLHWWDNEDIRKVVKPLGNTPATNAFDQSRCEDSDCGLVKTQADAYGNVTTLSADTGVDVVAPDGTVTNYRFSGGAPASLTDPAGNKATFTTTARGLISSITDRMGGVTAITYHTQTGKVASVTNALKKKVANTYTAQTQTFTNPANSEQVSVTFYNLTRIDYPDSTNERFTYDAKGNMLTRIDRAGKTWTHTYNGRGQVLTITGPTGGVTANTYMSDATLASTTDPDGIVTTYEYDAYKRLQRIIGPDSSHREISYDLNDRITSLRDENGNVFSYVYDANGNLTGITDPLGYQTTYGYDLMDRVSQVTDGLNKTATMAYNTMGRPQTFSDRNSLVTSFAYDPRGWRNSASLGGKTWTTGYNDEGVVTSITTPLNNTTTYQNDGIGHITAITDPLGNKTTLARDALARITGVTDPLNHTTAYAYDGRGLLSGVTMPVGTAVYERNALGLLTKVTDLKGSAWGLAYTSAGRLRSLTDPLGNAWQGSYDSLGRLSAIACPTGDSQTRTYDGAGNVTRVLYSQGPDLTFSYDAQNRLLTTESISFTRDAEGRVTSTTDSGTSFGAAYDSGGRLASVSYHDAFTVAYTYDATTGLLAAVGDTLTGAYVDFTYDDDRRLTGMTRSNGVNAVYTRDNAGRVTRIQDGAIDLQYALDGAGQITSTAMTVPLDPASLLTSGTYTYAYDNASQVSTTGYAYDKSGRLTASPGHTYAWSGDSRLTATDGAGLAYNGLGNLVTRTASGVSTHYYYNKAIGLSPMVAEKNDTTGSFVRYYVWTPGGQLLYMIGATDNKVYFPHFDRLGSTLALTDSTGTITDSYAYTPYGKLLQHSGGISQPFTFAGKWGVRQEGTSGSFYQMRARYYDATTGRFISREPLWPRISSPMQLNPYQYALLSPINIADIDGRGIPGNGLWRFNEQQWEDLVRPVPGETISQDGDAPMDRHSREALAIVATIGSNEAPLKMAGVTAGALAGASAGADPGIGDPQSRTVADISAGEASRRVALSEDPGGGVGASIINKWRRNTVRVGVNGRVYKLPDTINPYEPSLGDKDLLPGIFAMVIQAMMGMQEVD
jgi:RHS repeat-associated protein